MKVKTKTWQIPLCVCVTLASPATIHHQQEQRIERKRIGHAPA